LVLEVDGAIPLYLSNYSGFRRLGLDDYAKTLVSTWKGTQLIRVERCVK
jgi:hypothetical protein